MAKTREQILAELNGEAAPGDAPDLPQRIVPGRTREEILAEMNAPPPPREKTSIPQSMLQGAGDYGSFGLNDEIGGVLGTIGEKLGFAGPDVVRAQTREGAPIANPEADKREARGIGQIYRSYRDPIRDVKDNAAEDHPLAYHASGLATAIASPVMAAPKGAGFLARVGSGVRQGMAQSAGSSTADMTKEGGIVAGGKDILKGGGMGAAGEVVASGVGKLYRGIANRRVNKLGEDIVSEASLGGMAPGTPKTTSIQNMKLARAEDPIRDLVVNNANPQQGDMVRKALSAPPKKGLEMMQPVLAETAGVREAAYDAIEKAGAGDLDINAYYQKLGQSVAEAQHAGKGKLVEAIKAHANAVKDFAETNGPDSPITLRQLRGLTTDAESHAAGMLGGLNQTSQGTQIAKQVGAIAGKAMDDTLTEVASSKPGLEQVAETIRANNRKYNAAKTIVDALQQKVNKLPQAGGTFERAGKALAKSASGGMVGGAVGYASGGEDKMGHAATGALGGMALAALPRLGRAADRGMTSSAIKAIRGTSQAAPGMFGRATQAGTRRALNPMLLRTMGIGARRQEEEDQ